MARKCCYYEKGDEQKYVCTTDSNCPALTGWTLIGSWGVDDCSDCFGSSGQTGGEEEEPTIQVQIDPFVNKWKDELEESILLAHWIKENWDLVFPDLPRKGFDKFKSDLLKSKM